MSFKTFIGRWLFKDEPDAVEIACQELRDKMAAYEVRNFAFWAAVSRISRSMSKCEIKTYKDGEAFEGLEYYRLNVAPTLNGSRAEWLGKLIAQLYSHNEALVVMAGEQLIIADSFEKKDHVMKPDSFSDVEADGFRFRKSFPGDSVLYFRLNSLNIKKLLDGVYEAYASMLEAGRKFFESASGTRGILNINTQFGGSAEERSRQIEAVGSRFKALSKAKDAVVPLPAGYTYTDLTKSVAGATSRDYRDMINDVFDYTAAAFGIPPLLFRGEVAGVDALYDLYLTDCIDPLAALLEAELNKKLFSRDDYLRGSRVRIDTSRVKHFEIFDGAARLDKVIASGVLTINEARALIGLARSEDPECDKHLITKNYGSLEGITDEQSK